jgi:hypothetical protein
VKTGTPLTSWFIRLFNEFGWDLHRRSSACEADNPGEKRETLEKLAVPVERVLKMIDR